MRVFRLRKPRQRDVQQSESVVGRGAFYRCSSLQSASCERLASIAEHAFRECSSLAECRVRNGCVIAEGHSRNRRCPHRRNSSTRSASWRMRQMLYTFSMWKRQTGTTIVFARSEPSSPIRRCHRRKEVVSRKPRIGLRRHQHLRIHGIVRQTSSTRRRSRSSGMIHCPRSSSSTAWLHITPDLRPRRLDQDAGFIRHPLPKMSYACTLDMSKRIDFRRRKLTSMRLCIDLAKHHQAESWMPRRACAYSDARQNVTGSMPDFIAYEPGAKRRKQSGGQHRSVSRQTKAMQWLIPLLEEVVSNGEVSTLEAEAVLEFFDCTRRTSVRPCAFARQSQAASKR